MTASTTGELDLDLCIERSLVTGKWFGKAKRRNDAVGKIAFVNTDWRDTELEAQEELFAKVDAFEKSESID